MGKYYITFRSVTAAQRAQRLLEGVGYSAVMLRTPGWMAEKGCGYSLRMKEIRMVAQLLKEAGLSYGKIYYQKEKGKMEEVVL